MRIEWLNERRNRAMVITGWWKWKRFALVDYRVSSEENDYTSGWYYAGGPSVEDEIKAKLYQHDIWAREAKESAKRAQHWQPIKGYLPEARLLK